MRYGKGSEKNDIEAGEYGASCVNADENLVTVELAGDERLRYDPGRLHGVKVYREATREFWEGDRVQFTARYGRGHCKS